MSIILIKMTQQYLIFLSKDGRKKFLLVKQAFEQIKMEKGLMKAQNFVDSVQSQSVRPNADQFTPDEE